MANTRANARRGGDGSGNQEHMPPQVQGHVPPQLQEQVPPQVPNDPPIGDAMFEEFRASMTLLAQTLTTQSNRGDVDPANPIGGIDATRVREILRMNPLDLYGSKVCENPNGFTDEVYKVITIMGVSSIEKAELTSYQLKEVSQI